MHCTLCGTLATFFVAYKQRDFHKCNTCGGILLGSDHYLDFSKEKQRYDKHSDDVEDQGYQKFVSPIITAVLDGYQTNDTGLDYGCGKTAIIQKLLQRKRYNIVGYDPIYFPNDDVFKLHYNYITCCEVIEHFYNPNDEFEKLTKLLLPNGKLFLKTYLYNEGINFENWWYKNDPTHVFFYTIKTLEYIKFAYAFSSLRVTKDLIEFTK